ncbi:hypothetical protein [Sphingomonas sp. DC2300-3]|jgi:hypothetical protein|uniref:hypothetical protein n=1 Tax=unclassified Sphingomonas TaxID=196159 RepID=UPI003CF3A2DA
MRFTKSEGLTESEALLASLCEQSFFALWTYPNLFKKAAKEMIDLMVVFRNDVLLFSDKSCAYPETDNPELDWKRWYSRAVAKSAHQVQQAERWLRSQPTRIFLDAKATEPLPIDLPPPDTLKIHRICVATGAAGHCRRVTGQPMLGLDFTATDDEAPLRIGTVPEAHGFLHVFDADSLALVMRELDTISDFVEYLDAKADLVAGGKFKGAPTEADLLAYYLHHGRTFPDAQQEFVLQSNLWRQVEAQQPFQQGRELNRRHRLWDRLIDRVTRLYLAEELQFGNETTMSDHERLVRVMASESRFYRRILSQAIEDRAERARGGWIGSILPSQDLNVLYVLLMGPGARRDQYEEYRTQRSQELVLRCYAAKAARPQARFIVGIGLDAPGGEGSSEDLVYLDTLDWTAEEAQKAEDIRRDLGYFVEGKMQEQLLDVEEYPGSS